MHCTGKKAGRRLAGGHGEEDEEEEEDDDGQPGGSNPFAALADLKGAVNAAEFAPHRCGCFSTAAYLSTPVLLSTAALYISGHVGPAILSVPFWWLSLSVSQSVVHALLYAWQIINAYRPHNLPVGQSCQVSAKQRPHQSLCLASDTIPHTEFESQLLAADQVEAVSPGQCGSL